VPYFVVFSVSLTAFCSLVDLEAIPFNKPDRGVERGVVLLGVVGMKPVRGVEAVGVVEAEAVDLSVSFGAEEDVFLSVLSLSLSLEDLSLSLPLDFSFSESRSFFFSLSFFVLGESCLSCGVVGVKGEGSD